MKQIHLYYKRTVSSFIILTWDTVFAADVATLELVTVRDLLHSSKSTSQHKKEKCWVLLVEIFLMLCNY